MSGGAIAVKNGELLRRFPLCFRPRRRSSERLPRALVRHVLRPFAPFAKVPLRRWVDERNERFKTGHVRPSFFRRATAPLTFRGRGALGVGVLFFYYIIFYSHGSILPLWFYLRLYRRTRGGWRFAQRRSTTFTRCDFTLRARLAPLLSRRRRGGCAGSARAPVRAGRRCRDGCRFRWCRCPRGRA